MDQKSSPWAILKALVMIIFLPITLIWLVWKRTDWKKRNKWIATAVIVVVFIFMIPSDNNKKSVQQEVPTPVETRVQSENQAAEETVTDVEQPTTDQQEEIQQPEGEVSKVAHVVDGDTIKLDNGQVVRYIGIDTPETVDPRKPVQCFGKEASAKNKELVEGKEVRLIRDVSETDKYDRLLRYVYIGDMFVNDYLVRNGYAKSSTYPPDVKYQDQIRQAEEEARTNKRGLWADGICNPDPFCGDKICNNNETCGSCSQDCGSCPPPPPPPDDYQCNCSKTCAQMSSCTEAQYQLNACGCTRRDADKDGIACDTDCQ